MIKYNLKCHNNHEFESWFSDSKEFENLKNKRMLECIYCDSKKIIKSDTCKSILIETRSETSQTIKRILEESGFKRDFDFENKDPTKTHDWNESWLRG